MVLIGLVDLVFMVLIELSIEGVTYVYGIFISSFLLLFLCLLFLISLHIFVRSPIFLFFFSSSFPIHLLTFLSPLVSFFFLIFLAFNSFLSPSSLIIFFSLLSFCYLLLLYSSSSSCLFTFLHLNTYLSI